MTGPDKWPKDPLLRALRVIAVMAFLGLFVVVIADPARQDVTTEALLAGAILLQLGYEVIIKLPGISTNDRSDQRKDDPP